MSTEKKMTEIEIDRAIERLSGKLLTGGTADDWAAFERLKAIRRDRMLNQTYWSSTHAKIDNVRRIPA